MHRSVSRAPFRLISDSLRGSKVREKGGKNVNERFEHLQTVANSEVAGHGRFCFGGESIMQNLQIRIIDALRLGERDKAYNLLLNLSGQKNSLSDGDFVYILDYCAKSPDPLFVMETRKLMEEKNIALNNRCYMFIIQALTRGGYLEEAFKCLTFLGGNQCSNPVLPMYNAFLNGCARMQSTVHANSCLDLMEGRMIGKSEVTYWELLKLAVVQQNLSVVHEIWKEFTKYYSPSIIFLRKFIWCFTRLRDLVSACEALQHMVVLAFQGGDSLKRSTEGQFRSSKLDIPIPSNIITNIKGIGMEEHGQSLPYLFEGALATVGDDSLRTIDTDISCGQNQTLDGIEKFLTNSSVHSQKTYSSLPLSLVANQGNSFGVVSAVGQSVGFSPLKRDAGTKPVLKVLRWSFSDVIHACAQSGNYELAEQLFLQMQNLGLEPSCHTYDGFIRAVVSERGVADGLIVLKAMKKKNLKPHNATLASLSVGCSKILELDLAEALLDQIVESPLLHPFNTLLTACDVMDQPERAVRVLAKMKNMKLEPNIRTYELLFSLFGNVNAPYEKGNMLSQNDAAKRIRAIEMDMLKNGVEHSHVSMENLFKALGAEGMIKELIEAEDQFYRTHTYSGTAIYNTLLHSLVEAKESHRAIQVFKQMKLRDAATYNIMVDCCSILRCFTSACAILSMMLRDGFCPQTCTYTALIKILLANEDFDEALSLLDQLSLEGIQPDVLLFNTILLEANLKGRIDIIELVVERMHREKIQPDPSTCSYAFTAYVDNGFLNTAMEALQVLSMRMISEEESILEEKRKDFEEDFILAENPKTDLRIIKLFKDSEENLAAALLNLRWCEMTGFSISWSPTESVWARRLSSSYTTKRGS